MVSDITIIDIAREHHAELIRDAQLQRLADRAREAAARARRASDTMRAGNQPAGPPNTRPVDIATRPAAAR